MTELDLIFYHFRTILIQFVQSKYFNTLPVNIKIFNNHSLNFIVIHPDFCFNDTTWLLKILDNGICCCQRGLPSCILFSAVLVFYVFPIIKHIHQPRVVRVRVVSCCFLCIPCYQAHPSNTYSLNQLRS